MLFGVRLPGTVLFTLPVGGPSRLGRGCEPRRTGHGRDAARRVHAGPAAGGGAGVLRRGQHVGQSLPSSPLAAHRAVRGRCRRHGRAVVRAAGRHGRRSSSRSSPPSRSHRQGRCAPCAASRCRCWRARSIGRSRWPRRWTLAVTGARPTCRRPPAASRRRRRCSGLHRDLRWRVRIARQRRAGRARAADAGRRRVDLRDRPGCEGPAHTAHPLSPRCVGRCPNGSTVLSGGVALAGIVLAARIDPASVRMSLYPLEWPAVPIAAVDRLIGRGPARVRRAASRSRQTPIGVPWRRNPSTARGARHGCRGTGMIRFEDVSFEYPERRRAHAAQRRPPRARGRDVPGRRGDGHG